MMKLVYSNESHFLVTNAKNLIEAQGIETFVKNEFAQGAVGELSAFDCWPEVWVYQDSDYEPALTIIESTSDSPDAVDWICDNCAEKNDRSFEICWSCQRENGSTRNNQ